MLFLLQTRTLKVQILPHAEDYQNTGNKRRLYVLLALSFIQPVFMWWLTFTLVWGGLVDNIVIQNDALIELLLVQWKWDGRQFITGAMNRVVYQWCQSGVVLNHFSNFCHKRIVVSCIFCLWCAIFQSMSMYK